MLLVVHPKYLAQDSGPPKTNKLCCCSWVSFWGTGKCVCERECGCVCVCLCDTDILRIHILNFSFIFRFIFWVHNYFAPFISGWCEQTIPRHSEPWPQPAASAPQYGGRRHSLLPSPLDSWFWYEPHWRLQEGRFLHPLLIHGSGMNCTDDFRKVGSYTLFWFMVLVWTALVTSGR